MRRSRLPSVARLLLAEIPDADLLERYVEHRADDAFAQLVTRYSRLVWGQCRNLLPGDADADDAFQATFLTLARSAKSIRPGAPLGPWLHGVAYRVCGNARRAMERRAKREKACAIPEADRPVADSTWEAAFAAVSEEVQKLPDAQRTAFVLCCIEGRSTTEAAASLGQKLGTFSARLTRAKQTLLDRLAKRGLGASILALGGITGTVAVAPTALIARTLALVPSGVTIPSSVLALTQGVTGMFMLRFKLLAAGVLVATGLGLSFGGGWSGEAAAQVAGTPGTKPVPPKEDVAVAQLKAELEKVKAMLARAEAEAANDAANQNRLETYRRLMNDARNVELPTKFEYEPVPKEGLTDFEERLARREKAGWEFVGQVTIKGFGPEEKLVFRKLPTPMLPLHGKVDPNRVGTGQLPMRLESMWFPTPVTPAGDPAKAPTAPGGPAGAAPKPPRVGTISVNGNETNSKEVIAALIGIKPGEILDMTKLKRAEENLTNSGLLAEPPKVVVFNSDDSDYKNLIVTLKEKPRGKGTDKDTPQPGVTIRREAEDAQRVLDQARIAQLEKMVRDLKAAKFINSKIAKVSLTTADFGSADVGDIVSDLFRMYGSSRFEMTLDKDGLRISAPEEIIAEIKVYMAKLKK